MLAEFRQQYRRINVQFTVKSVVEVEAQLFRGHPEVVDADLADYFGSGAGREVITPCALGG
jgi:hypothetical protein